MTLNTCARNKVWVGQSWAANGGGYDIVRVTVVDPYLGLIEVVGAGRDIVTAEPLSHFIETHRPVD